MFEPPPPPDTYQPPEAPYVLHKPLSLEQQTTSKVPHEDAIFLKAAHRGDTFRGWLDKYGWLWMRTRNSDGNVRSQTLRIGSVQLALAEGGIDIQPEASEVVRFRIGEEIEVAATVKLHVGFFGGHKFHLISYQVRWLSLDERVEKWNASLREGWKSYNERTTWLQVTYRDSYGDFIHQDEIDVYDVLTKSGIKLKGRPVIRFALGADLMEATLEFEVGLLGFSRKLKLLSVERKRGEAWRLSTPEKETP